MDCIDKIDERRIIIIASLLLLIVLAGYLFTPTILFIALPIVSYYSIKASNPIESLIPFAIIVTWGAQIWNTAFESYYTILKLLAIVVFFYKVISLKSKCNLWGLLLPLLLFVFYNIFSEALYYPGGTRYLFYVNIIICYVVIYLVSRYVTLDHFESFSFAIGIGVLFSAVVSLISPIIPSLFEVVQGMIQTDNAFGGEEIDKRFSSLTYDPNLFGMYVDCALSLNVIVLIQRQFKKSFVRISLCVALMAVGLMTLSKAYFLVSSILFILCISHILKSREIRASRKTVIFIVIIVAAAILSYYMIDYVDALLSRFDSKNASELTTGRTDIMSYYVNYLLNNPKTLLFGNSLLGGIKDYSTPHNFALYLLYFFGVIGTLLYVIVVVRLMKLNKRYRVYSFKYFSDKKLHYLPLGIYLLYSFTIDPFALYDVKMIILSASFAACQPLISKVR